jgi:hypothetical protein
LISPLGVRFFLPDTLAFRRRIFECLPPPLGAGKFFDVLWAWIVFAATTFSV